MSVINAGRVQPQHKATWNSATSYIKTDIVLYNGNGYWCIQDNVNKVPNTETSYWSLMVQRGSDADLTQLENYVNLCWNSVTETFTYASPIGEVKIFAGATAPQKYLICDGAEISRTTYADLFTVIGTAFGAGNGSTTFALPDFRHRAPFGYDASNSKFNAIGKTGGEEAHALTIDEIPSHNHNIGLSDVTSQRGYLGVYGSNYGVDGIHEFYTFHRGGDQAHNNLPPYITINYIIRALA